MKPDITGLFTVSHTDKQVYWYMSQCSSTLQLLHFSSTCSNNVTLCTRMSKQTRYVHKTWHWGTCE